MKAENPERDDTKPGTSVPPNRQGTVKEPSKSSAREAREVFDTLAEVLSEESAQDFIDHRKAKRAKLTPRAAQLIAAKLRGHPDPASVVEDSIANGWTGVFPERVAGKPRDKPFSVYDVKIDLSKFNDDGSLRQ